MSQPPPYNRLKNFTQYALDHPGAPYNASDHDAELDAIEQSVDALIGNMAMIQRDDGLVANLAVHPDALSTATKAIIGAGSTGNLNWIPRGLWITATQYALGNVVEQAGTSYVCAAAHVSGVFATDKAAGKWLFLGGTIITLAASAVTFAPVGDIASTNVQSALAELDTEKAKKGGDSTLTFMVATATLPTHATPMAQAQDNSLLFAVGTGTGNAILATINPSGMTALKDGFEVCIRAPGANSLPNPTFDLTLGTTDTGALNIVRGDNGNALVNGDIAGASHELWLRYRSGTNNWRLMNPGNVPVTLNNVPSPQDLVALLHIDADTGHRDMIASGWMPAFFNQQWGGAPHYFEVADGATGVPYKFEAATGYVEQNLTFIFGDANASTSRSQGFKVSQNVSISALWMKIGKVANPTNNLELRVQADDGTGKPTANFTAITNGTATAQSGKLHSSDANGQWVRFAFATPCALVAGTQYHLTLKSSGAADATNYWIVAGQQTSGHYPHGQFCTGDNVPAWTASSGHDLCFLIEASTVTASLQTGGVFGDGKLQFFEGAPLNQSNARVRDLRTFAGLDLTDFTLAITGNSWTKDKTILDIQYGLDHDRILLRCNVTTGYAQLDMWDSAGTKKTVTGNTDVSASNSTLGIRIRAKGDGQDVVQLWENGNANAGNFSAQTINFDKLFSAAQIGTFWLGGGFQVAPAWTKDTAMGLLPSADGWTWTTTTAAVEANCMSVAGNKLYQNKGGYAAGADGYYLKNALALSNANGWAMAIKKRATTNTNTKDIGSDTLRVQDGTKNYFLQGAEYYLGVSTTFSAGAYGYPQIDMKWAENVVYTVGKGSDALTFVNGRLVADGTAVLTTASANNEIHFGDVSTTANENADVIYDYVKYYNTAWLPPQFTAGSLSEFAIWNGDHTALLATVWNAGAPISAKVLCGAQKNYVGDEVVQTASQADITQAPTVASSVPTLIPEMERFVVGSRVVQEVLGGFFNNTGGFATILGVYADGIVKDITFVATVTGGYTDAIIAASKDLLPFGLHKIDARFWNNGNTSTASINNLSRRKFNFEARA